MPGTPELRATPVTCREAGHEITLSFTRTRTLYLYRVQLYRMTGENDCPEDATCRIFSFIAHRRPGVMDSHSAPPAPSRNRITTSQEKVEASVPRRASALLTRHCWPCHLRVSKNQAPPTFTLQSPPSGTGDFSLHSSDFSRFSERRSRLSRPRWCRWCVGLRGSARGSCSLSTTNTPTGI